MGRRSESYDPTSKAVLRFGALRENPGIIAPLMLPSIESYGDVSVSGGFGRGFDAHERATLLQEAFEKGVEEGRRQLSDETKAQVETKLAQLNSALLALDKAIEDRNAVLDHLRIAEERDLATFAVEIAAEIIGSGIYDKRDFLIDSVNKAVATSIDAKNVTLRLNPNDIATIRSLVDSGDIDLRGDISLTPDRTVEPASVVVEADAMRLDLQLGTSMERLKQFIKNFKDGQ